MAFIETKITPEMIAKYDMQKDYLIVKNHCHKDYYAYGEKDHYWGAKPQVYTNLENPETRDIIINEQKDCYLRYGCLGFTEIIGTTAHTYYLLYWRGQRIYFVIRTEFQKIDEENKIYHCTLHLYQALSLQPIVFNTELLQVIKDAVNMYEQNHNFSGWQYINTFNFNLFN